MPYESVFTTDLLTRRPEALTEIDLIKLLAAGPGRGKIVLALRIAWTGEVVSVSVERCDFPDDVSRLFQDAFGKLRFRPGEIHGKPVSVLMWVETRFGAGLEQITSN